MESGTTPHGTYRFGLTYWREGTDSGQSGGLIVQCTCPGPHSDLFHVTANTTHHDGIDAWIITATGPDPTRLQAQATAVAQALGQLLPTG
jgi:hypothetical protein